MFDTSLSSTREREGGSSGESTNNFNKGEGLGLVGGGEASG